MPRNVEIKARVKHVKATIALTEALSDTVGEILEQEDTFFPVPQGRLKLRQSPDGRGELIAYKRADHAGAKVSSYEIFRTSDPESLRAALAEALGVRGVVRKRRLLYLAGKTRIHIDEVEGLGTFLELEVVLGDGESEAEGARIADDLLHRLGIPKADRVEGAYVDLIEGAREG